MFSAQLQSELTVFRGLNSRLLALAWLASYSFVAPFSYYSSAQCFPSCHRTLWASRWLCVIFNIQLLFKLLILFCFSHTTFRWGFVDVILQQSHQAAQSVSKLRWDHQLTLGPSAVLPHMLAFHTHPLKQQLARSKKVENGREVVMWNKE